MTERLFSVLFSAFPQLGGPKSVVVLMWTGLVFDHLSFSVVGVDELNAAAATLDQQGVAHSGVKNSWCCIPA
jgi:hypothetical protein